MNQTPWQTSLAKGFLVLAVAFTTVSSCGGGNQTTTSEATEELARDTTASRNSDLTDTSGALPSGANADSAQIMRPDSTPANQSSGDSGRK